MTPDDAEGSTTGHGAMLRPWRILLVFAMAAVGIGLAVSSGIGKFASVSERPAADGPAPRPATASTLSQRLAVLHDVVAIRSEQEPAWKRFAREMTELETLTRAYERRLASGKSADLAGERARHALIFGAAMNEVDASLSSEQTVRLYRLARDLAGSSVCRALAN